jgi:hypothetical protein
MIEQLPIFPCNDAKVPMVARGFKSARRGAKARGWPLIGFATGAASGIDVLDIDTGVDWYDQNFDAIPQTRAHQTQRGLHLLFRHAAGLRCSTSKIATGVDVRADGGYAIWWPREGLPIEDHPLCEWPEWLLKEAMQPKRDVAGSVKRVLSTSIPLHCHGVDGWTEALFKLDPVCWRNSDGSAEGYLGWLKLMMACKAVGIGLADFTRWSTQDQVYANDADVIARKWNSVRAEHGGALSAALKEAGIKVDGRGREISAEEPLRERSTKTRNWRSRLECTCNALERNPTEPMLFWAACVFAEVMDECKKPTSSIAVKLLEGSAKACGLTRLLGREGVRQTITNGLHHVEQQILERANGGAKQKENENG